MRNSFQIISYVLVILLQKVLPQDKENRLYLDSYGMVISKIESTYKMHANNSGNNYKYTVPQILTIVALTEDLDLEAKCGKEIITIPGNNISLVFFSSENADEVEERIEALTMIDYLSEVEENTDIYNAKLFSPGPNIVLNYNKTEQIFRSTMSNLFWLNVGDSHYSTVRIFINMEIKGVPVDSDGTIGKFKNAKIVFGISGIGDEFYNQVYVEVKDKTKEEVVEIGNIFKKINERLDNTNLRVKIYILATIPILVSLVAVPIYWWYFK